VADWHPGDHNPNREFAQITDSLASGRASRGRLCLGEACGTTNCDIIACGEVGPDVSLANIRAMYEAFREYGTYA